MSQSAGVLGTNFVQRSQPTEESCMPIVCKTTLIGLGILCIIGSAVAAGVLFSHLGYSSLGFLAGIPIGIGLIILGVRCTKDAAAPDRVRAHSEVELPAAAKELKTYLFDELFRKDTIKYCLPLGKMVSIINDYLKVFNERHGLQLKAMITVHANIENDPWQTIKILDCSIKQVGQESPFLKALNDDLYKNHGLISNGGDSNQVVRGKQKQTPVYFIKNNVPMSPQIQISRIDIRKILNLINEEQYFQELQDAYKGKKSD